MTMTHLRGRVAQRCEAVTLAALRDVGLDAQDYGQGMLSDAARALLRDTQTIERWKQDYIVKTPSGRLALVDAKFSFSKTPNHSVEMRSLLAAGASDRPTFYVFSHWQLGGTFTPFEILHYQQVPIIGPNSWPCCEHCRRIFTTDPDPMRALPERCCCQTRGTTASGTPYFVVKPPFIPLASHAFDMEPWFAVSPDGRGWDRNIKVGR